MGVSGVGKPRSASASPPPRREFIEGDDLHPAANIEKMSGGHPSPTRTGGPGWRRLPTDRGTTSGGSGPVLTCSALKRTYRDMLRRGAADTFFVHLDGPGVPVARADGDASTSCRRRLLQSQIDTLEPLEEDEHGSSLDVALPVDEIVAAGHGRDRAIAQTGC